MAAVGMEMMAQWGADAVRARLASLNTRIAAGVSGCRGVRLPDSRHRAPHVLSLAFPDGTPEKLFERLAAENIHVARRVGRMRLSPHVYNDEEDCDRFVEALLRLLR